MAISNIDHEPDPATTSSSTDEEHQIFVEDLVPDSPLLNKTNEVFCKIIKQEENNYSDQTGAFPLLSSRGYRYIMVFYYVDSNAILVRPTKSKTSIEMNATVISMIQHLSRRGFKPKYYVLNNKVSDLLKTTFRKLEIKFELVPPGMHRRNIAGRAI